MYQTDFDAFKQALNDLCVAVNRPINDDLTRVFWEDLKKFSLPEVLQRAKYLRAAGKRQFTSNDLRPEADAKATPTTFTPPPEYPKFHGFGQRCLMQFLMRHEEKIEGPELQRMVFAKNKLLGDFRDMDAEGETVTAEQVREAMFRAFDRVLQQRQAA
jgi:hypothetical protein